MDIKEGIPLPVTEVKATGDAWEVSGYASTYNNVDLGGDVVMRGAFDDWLAGWRQGKNKTRFLFSHQSHQILGPVLEMKSDDRGLFVRAKISKTQLGSDVHTLLKDEALDSFSIGYIPTDIEYGDSGERKLITMALPEFSLVAIPMNTEADVTHVKRLADLKTDVPFEDLIGQITAHLMLGVDEAEALHSRRLEEKRLLSESHLSVLEKLLGELKGSSDRIEAILRAGRPDTAEANSASLLLEEVRRRKALRDRRGDA